MKDTFWTDELVKEYASLYIKESWEQLGELKKNITSIEQFKSSKAPKKEHEVWLTEDGVEVPIVEGNQLFYVSGFDFKMSYFAFTDTVNVEGLRGKFPQFKYFSTREAAETYILNNRPLLSLNDVRSVLAKLVNVRQASDSMQELTALVKQRLNQ